MATQLPLDELSTVFARVNGMLLTEETVGHAVELLAQAAKETIPGTIGAGVTVIDSAGRKVSTGSTDSVVRQADDLQYETGQGPCLSAWASSTTFRVDDAQTDPRWPEWSAAVADLPVRSVLSTPLIHGEQTVGALKVYSAFPNAFSADVERLLVLFAGPAAALLAHVQTKEMPQKLSDSLQHALGSRDAINMGKGILMERHSLDEAAAMVAMMRMSRNEGIALREAAGRIVAGPDQTK